ncbi:MAG: cellulase family glycosylhydrolase [Desulfobacterota bacterium]|nr:cellulase family glycosylhydrolase [Thermodesulfobacteriota bacterium]
MEDGFTLGVNYWPIESAMSWWHRFDPGVVGEDFSRIGEVGLKAVRIFLLWEDFQPDPKKVRSDRLKELIRVMDLAHERGLRVLLTLFTGHMSGMNYLPPWMVEVKEEPESRFYVYSGGRRRKNKIRNFYADREAREAQKFLLREVAGALQGHPGIWAWDLGNEPSNVTQPPTRSDALVWLEEMVSELKKRDESIPVTLGLHQEDLEEDRRMGPAEVARFCDFLSIHAYSIYARWAEGRLDEAVVPFLGLLTRWLGGKEVLIEEVGLATSNAVRGEWIVTEDDGFDYYKRLLENVGTSGFLGILFWCYGDYGEALWNIPPFDEKIHERYFGLFRKDRSPKAYVKLLKEFQVEPDRRRPVLSSWIDIEPQEYYRNPMAHLERLFGRFKGQGRSHEPVVPNGR